MSQKQQRSAQRRSEKRHRREVERRQARTATRKQRPTGRPEFAADEAPPLTSVDDETTIHPYLTQLGRESDHRAGHAPQRWRSAFPGFWTHADVAALDDDALFAALAERGLSLTRDEVRAHIDRMPPRGSAWRMSRIYWLPTLAPGLSPADRDFLGLAAVELWRRLRPDAPPVETLLALLVDTDDLDGPPALLSDLLRFFAAVRPHIDPSQPETVGGVVLPLSMTLRRMILAALRVVEQHPDLSAAALAEADLWRDIRFPRDRPTDRLFVRHMLAQLSDELGRHEEAEQRLRAAVAEDPDDQRARKLLAMMLHEHADGDRARLVEAIDLWDATRPSPDDPEYENFQSMRDEMLESLRQHDGTADMLS